VDRPEDKEKQATGYIDLEISIVPLYNRSFMDTEEYNVAVDELLAECEADQTGSW
jgi:hypothetical protein